MGCRGFLEAIEEGAIYDFLVVPARQAKFDKNPLGKTMLKRW